MLAEGGFENGQPVGPARRHGTGREPRRLDGQRLPDLVEVLDIGVFEAAHPDAAVREQLQQAFRDQRAQSLAYGHAGHAELLGDLPLDEAGALRLTPVDDALQDGFTRPRAERGRRRRSRCRCSRRRGT